MGAKEIFVEYKMLTEEISDEKYVEGMFCFL
jgi:hypothetical protein